MHEALFNEYMSALPPGQFNGHRFVIYTINGVPSVDDNNYVLELFGEVEKPLSFTLSEIRDMATARMKSDFHCVTRWSIRDCEWGGVPFSALKEKAGVKEEACFAYAHCLDGYTTVMPMENMHDAMFAVSLNGAQLTQEQGAPVRLVVPSLYGWKSAKWVQAVELLKEYRDGYWEERGYHERGDFLVEERFKDPAARFIHKKVAKKQTADR
ncbi:MAG: molybdopterin-dependent oxidoreductase [Methanomassiliicoccales archaeon]|nr:molybdopterin-dependent oxidoreductase [Methanomassiliicoccales archaeon]